MFPDMSVFSYFWLFAVSAVVDNAGRATFPAVLSTVVPAFHHPWGHACTSISVEGRTGNEMTWDWPKSCHSGVDLSAA